MADILTAQPARRRSRTLVGPLLAIVVITIVGLALAGTVFVLGLRARSPGVQRSIIWLTRHVMNPRTMRTAGQPGEYSIIRAVGRRTGRTYDTPVGVVAAGDDFLVTLPYGTGSQWLRNVLAAGEATLIHEGRVYAVDRPELVPFVDVKEDFSQADQRSAALIRMDQVLRLRRAVPDAAII